MAEGVALNPMAGGSTVDTEMLPNGRHAQRMKFVLGAADADSGDVSASNPMPSQQSLQKSATVTLQSAATADGNGSVATSDGYNGALILLISNSTGTCTVTIQGSFDNFATAQDIMTIGLIKLADSANGVNVSRNPISGVISVAASTSYAFQLLDLYPYTRAVISGSLTLAGCTVKLYEVPV